MSTNNKLGNRLLAIVGVFFLLLFLAGKTLFIVYPWQSALILQFGEIVATERQPGLYYKAPWQSLLKFDSRVLTIDSIDTDRYITAEKENLLVDSYVKWRIIDPAKFYERLRGDETSAVGRLQEIIKRGLRDEIGKRTVKGVVADARDEVMILTRDRANEGAKDYGIEILDVRMKRVNLPEGVSEEVYKNMIEERRRIANERRSEGEAEKEKIKAEADRDRVIILAEAGRRSEETRGQGDAESAGIYSKAFAKYPEFYDFYRSMAAYRRSLGSSNDLLIIRPNSDFFRYLHSEEGKERSKK